MTFFKFIILNTVPTAIGYNHKKLIVKNNNRSALKIYNLQKLHVPI